MDTNTRQIALSVIVPCFNVEPYLDRSLGCLERQWNERDDYEIILINDASTDGTIDKLNEFKQRHPNNVVVIDKIVNAGVAEARNSGLDIAQGQWIVFFDPDDALVDNGYDRLLELSEKVDCDIISFGVKAISDQEWHDDDCKQMIKPDIVWSGSSNDYILNYHFGLCWCYLFKRDVLNRHRFSNMVICEDTVFNLPIFLEKWNICRTDACIYKYIVRKASATTTINSQRLNQSCDDILRAIYFLRSCEEGLGPELINRIRAHQDIFALNLVTRLLLSDKKKNEILPIKQQLKELSLLPLNGDSSRIKLFDVLIRDPSLMIILRPLYRMLRFLRKSLIHG